MSPRPGWRGWAVPAVALALLNLVAMPLLKDALETAAGWAPSLRDVPRPPALPPPTRSEEHTSELQSPDHIVCRLLLEKKKKTLRHNLLQYFRNGCEKTNDSMGDDNNTISQPQTHHEIEQDLFNTTSKPPERAMVSSIA